MLIMNYFLNDLQCFVKMTRPCQNSTIVVFTSLIAKMNLFLTVIVYHGDLYMTLLCHMISQKLYITI